MEPNVKVVVNRCYGGFSLSDEAVERLIALGMKSSPADDNDQSAPIAVFDKKRRNRIFNEMYYVRHSSQNDFRCDPRVVQVVEELGEKANGPCAELEVVEIPFSGPEGWYIDEYDGREKINANHESW